MHDDLKYKSHYSLIRCLLDKDLDPQEVWRTHDIYPHEVLLPRGASAFVYCSRRGRKHIFVSSNLSRLDKVRLLVHELDHVIEHLPGMGYIVGIDMQRKLFERQADMFFYELAGMDVRKKI